MQVGAGGPERTEQKESSVVQGAMDWVPRPGIWVFTGEAAVLITLQSWKHAALALSMSASELPGVL